MSRRVNFFVGVRLCNLVNETAPLPQFCVIFLNISLFREMMLEKNTKICVIRRTHCWIVNWRTRPLWLDKCVWDERSARQKTRLKKQLTLSVTWSTFDHFHVQVVIRTFQCFTDWYVDLERRIKLLCKSRIMQFGRLNCATSAGLCNLSQYLPISREKCWQVLRCATLFLRSSLTPNNFIFRHFEVILALYTFTGPCFRKDLPHSATISLKTASAVHKCCPWKKCTLLLSKFIYIFGAVSKRRMRRESTNHKKC